MDELKPGPETAALISYLDSQRRHIVEMLDGLSEADLHRAVLPSGWTALGLIQHLAIDVERFWFRAVIAGEPYDLNGPNAWIVAPEMPAAEILALYEREIALANEIIARTSPEAPPAWWPVDLFGDYRLDTVREIVLHVITETACHAGHIDILRELIDGRQRLVLT
jgi:hypothetical protein